MTTRNLKRTWRGVVSAQYQTDFKADAPFPIRYLIWADQWQRDIIITIPHKTDLATLRRSVGVLFKACHTAADSAYQDDFITVRLRKRSEGDDSEGIASAPSAELPQEA